MVAVTGNLRGQVQTMEARVSDLDQRIADTGATTASAFGRVENLVGLQVQQVSQSLTSLLGQGQEALQSQMQVRLADLQEGLKNLFSETVTRLDGAWAAHVEDVAVRLDEGQRNLSSVATRVEGLEAQVQRLLPRGGMEVDSPPENFFEALQMGVEGLRGEMHAGMMQVRMHAQEITGQVETEVNEVRQCVGEAESIGATALHAAEEALALHRRLEERQVQDAAVTDGRLGRMEADVTAIVSSCGELATATQSVAQEVAGHAQRLEALESKLAADAPSGHVRRLEALESTVSMHASAIEGVGQEVAGHGRAHDAQADEAELLA